MRIVPTAALLLALLLGGCSSTQEIEASRPQARNAEAPEGSTGTSQARLKMALEQGESVLPEEVDRFQFRISDIQIRRSDGEWIRLSSELHQFELPLNKSAGRRTVLETRIPAASYDSVALSFDRIFARFSENSGAPLAVSRNEPLRFAFDMTASLDRLQTLVLRFEPGASLRRTDDCRWFFLPVVRPAIESADRTDVPR